MLRLWDVALLVVGPKSSSPKSRANASVTVVAASRFLVVHVFLDCEAGTLLEAEQQRRLSVSAAVSLPGSRQATA